MKYYPDFFNDVFGPVMQPGSSSHTAAPCRLGLMARSFLGEEPKTARFILDREGSFAGTFGLMNEDKGMLAGVMGFAPDDERIYDVFDLAGQSGLVYEFIFDQMKESDHLNSLKIVLRGESGRTISLVGDSTGGGMVRVRKLDGIPVDFIGDTYVLLFFAADAGFSVAVEDVEGFVEQNSYSHGDARLLYVKSSQRPDIDAVRRRYPGLRVALLEPILPVIIRRERRPQLFTTVGQWVAQAHAQGVDVGEIAIQYEMDSSLWPRQRVVDTMRDIRDVLIRQIHTPYEQEITDRNPFYRYDGDKWTAYQRGGKVLSGPLMGEVIRRAIGVNSKVKGTPIVPGPMGTGGGYLFSALYSVKEAYGYSDEELLRGLFVAAGIGALAYSHTDPTGEVIGCAGECGVCCAMGAAAIVAMAGAGERIEAAASLALQGFIGLPCDPIVGGFEAPCYSRVITAASMAVVYADLALAGVPAVLPFEEVLRAADAVGRALPPQLLCTGSGGCCDTPTGRKCESAYRQWAKNQGRH